MNKDCSLVCLENCNTASPVKYAILFWFSKKQGKYVLQACWCANRVSTICIFQVWLVLCSLPVLKSYHPFVSGLIWISSQNWKQIFGTPFPVKLAILLYNAFTLDWFNLNHINCTNFLRNNAQASHGFSFVSYVKNVWLSVMFFAVVAKWVDQYQ